MPILAHLATGVESDNGLECYTPPSLPMGTHFLWHVFGAITAHLMLLFVYCISRDGLTARRAA